MAVAPKCPKCGKEQWEVYEDILSDGVTIRHHASLLMSGGVSQKEAIDKALRLWGYDYRVLFVYCSGCGHVVTAQFLGKDLGAAQKLED